MLPCSSMLLLCLNLRGHDVLMSWLSFTYVSCGNGHVLFSGLCASSSSFKMLMLSCSWTHGGVLGHHELFVAPCQPSFSVSIVVA